MSVSLSPGGLFWTEGRCHGKYFGCYQRVMVVRYDFPFLLWDCHFLFAANPFRGTLSVRHFTKVETVIQDSPDGIDAPGGILFWGCPFRIAQLGDGRNPFLVKLPCNLCAGFAVHSQREDITYNLSFILLDEDSIFDLFTLFISKGDLPKHILPVFTFILYGGFQLDRKSVV